eukprot:scaffold96014_cov45-Prasinocladus_malaysianus.AAC.3
MNASLVGAIAERALPQLDRFSGGHLAVMSWAVADAGPSSRTLLKALAVQLCGGLKAGCLTLQPQVGPPLPLPLAS